MVALHPSNVHAYKLDNDVKVWSTLIELKASLIDDCKEWYNWIALLLRWLSINHGATE